MTRLELLLGATVAIIALPFTGLLLLYQWPAGIAAANSPLVVWHLLAILGVAAWVVRYDLPLGLFAAYLALDALRAPVPARAWLMADAVALGAAAFILVRRLGWPWTDLLRFLLGLSGVVQAVLAGLQLAGLDPFYAADAPFKATGTMVGTLGNDTWLGAYLALVGAAAPWWSIPACLAGQIFARNRLGLLALLIALAVRYRHAWRFLGPPATIGAVLAGWWWADKTWDSLWSRLEVWRQGLRVWWDHGIVFGLGPGSWAWYLPQFDTREHFAQAHQEYLQLLFEGGAVGLGFVVWWVWIHRARLVGHPGAWALAVLCAGTFPFHVAIVAATAVIVLALPATHAQD
ncbi:MAG TPA: hypothetical protein VKA83_09120 [Methylomirabilota bacterium]|nr:hypothetical protein [Methylomirabilota bacterium]